MDREGDIFALLKDERQGKKEGRRKEKNAHIISFWGIYYTPHHTISISSYL